MKIYTKAGDKGLTTLIGGKVVSKGHLRIEAYGSMDELISFTGYFREIYKNDYYREVLLGIQDRLMTASSILAVDDGEKISGLPNLIIEDILYLEQEIDKMEALLSPLKSFVLPGGNEVVSFCHILRTVCRRVERNCVRIDENNDDIEIIIKYLNRLSDFLFVLSRYISMDMGAEEIPWTPRL